MILIGVPPNYLVLFLLETATEELWIPERSLVQTGLVCNQG